MKTFLLFIVLAALAAGVWLYLGQEQRTKIEDLKRGAAESAERVKEAIKEKIPDMSVRAEDIKEELARTGKVVRQKAREATAALADATADARITAGIKAKLVADLELSALKISVNTTDGVVTLSGTVSSEEKIARAMNLALSFDGVREVISTLQVKPAE